MSGKNFSVLHANIRRLNANFENFSDLLYQLNHSFSLIGLSEIKVNSQNDANISNLYNIPGFDFNFQSSLSNAGGVGFYISRNISYFVREDLSRRENEYESLWIEVKSDLHHNLICGVVYRHPNSDIDVFNNYINEISGKINSENKFCIIMGDFNIDLLKSSHSNTEEFLNNLESYFFNPHILQPTRITNHSATLIDNIFFNSITHHTISGNIVHDLSDHLPNFLIINKFSTLPKHFKITRRDYSNFNEDSFFKRFRQLSGQQFFLVMIHLYPLNYFMINYQTLLINISLFIS